MKLTNIVLFLTGFIFCLAPVKAVDRWKPEDPGKQHAYVLSRTSANPLGRELVFFNNGDGIKLVGTYGIWDHDLRHDKALVRTQHPGPKQTYGVVVRPFGTNKYINSVGDKNNPNIVQEPGFWAFDLGRYKLIKISDAMYEFSVDNEGIDDCMKPYKSAPNNEIWINYLFYNKDDRDFAHSFFPDPWITRKDGVTRKFNYDGFTSKTSDIKIRTQIIEHVYSLPVRAQYDVEGENGAAIGPGKYTIKCDSVSKKMRFSKEESFKW